MEYRFGQWLPDGRDFKNPGLEQARNVIPGPNGYGPARGPVGIGASISGTVIGGTATYLDDTLTVYLIATTQDLYVVRNSIVTASGLSLSLNSTDTVAFARFGVSIYATVRGGGTWVLGDISSSTAFVSAPGSPPTGNNINRVADFLVIGDLTDIDASAAPYRVRWSAFNNPGADWITDIGRQSGAFDFDPQYGPITGISGGRFGLVFQQRAVSSFTPNGGPQVFSRDTFERERGCIARASLIQVGDRVFYLSYDGFYVTDGTTPQPISQGKVWQWFKSQIDDNYLEYVQGDLDFRNRCVVWAFPKGSSRTLNCLLYYYWESGEWSYVEQALDWLLQGGNSGKTLSQLDAEFGDLDSIPGSLDDLRYSSEIRALQGVVDGEISDFSGNTLAARFESGDAQPFVGRRSFVSEVTPLIEASQMSVRLGVRDKINDPVVQTEAVNVGPVGFAPLNGDARYFRVIIDIPAGVEWSEGYGYQLNAVDSGAV